MHACKYKYDELTFDSYTELLNYLDGKNLNLENVSDVVYSRTASQQEQFEKLNRIKSEYTPQKNKTSVYSFNDEPGMNTEGGMSILDFFDTPQYVNANGEYYVPPFIDEDYKKHRIEKMLEDPTNNYTEEQCRQIVQQELDNGDKIQEDAILIHQLLSDRTISDPEATTEKFRGNASKKVKGSRLDDQVLLGLLFGDTQRGGLKHFYVNEKGQYADSLALTGINLTSKLKTTGLKIFGHIDYLFIDSCGHLHLYLVKTSVEKPQQWIRVKWEKYKHQLAFLKGMLAENGLNVKDISLNIVPIQLTYNEDYTKIENLRVCDVVSCSTKLSGGYSMDKYDQIVSKFLNKSNFPQRLPVAVMENANNLNRMIFPELYFDVDGYIDRSAASWISRAPSVDENGIEPLVIRETDDGYDVIIQQVVHKVKSKKDKLHNEEIKSLVTEHLDQLESNISYVTSDIKASIESSFLKGFPVFETNPKFQGFSHELSAVLHKYLSDYTEDPQTKKRNCNWELISDLVNANVLVFRNKNTGAIDVMVLTALDLNVKKSFHRGHNILGSYYTDGDNRKSDMESDWGNIEAVRTMSLLNELIPSLISKGVDVKLGTIGVFSLTGGHAFRSYNIGELNKNYYRHIMEEVHKQNQNVPIQNNFVNATFIDLFDELVQQFNSVFNSSIDPEQNILESLGFDAIASSKGSFMVTELSDYKKKQILMDIVERIYRKYPLLSNPEHVQNITRENSTRGKVANLLVLATAALNSVNSSIATIVADTNPIELLGMTATTQSNRNINRIVQNLTITYDTISSEFLEEFSEMRSFFDQFYESAGYTSIENMTLGDQARQYNNLYEVDVRTGKKTMSFKNPYDMSNDLKDYERRLLKYMLHRIALISTNGAFKYGNWQDARIADYVKNHPEYLWIPLTKASAATSRQSVDGFKAKWKNTIRRIRNATQRFDEFINGISDEERQLIGNPRDFYNLRLQNPFSISMMMDQGVEGRQRKLQERAALVEKYGTGYFETNVENILIDFLFQDIATKQLNKFLVVSKAMMLQLYLTGRQSDNSEETDKQLKHIQDYLKVNVYKSPIMSKVEQSIMGVVQPTKSIVTKMLVGFNLVAGVRDTFEGVQQNFMRAFIKYNTDLNASNVAKAYAYVCTHSTGNAMAINLLSRLCLKYRLSNADIGRIAERAKTGRGGLTNPETAMFSTLRGPDFLNRMVLFVAKCMQDGCWDAISLDENGNIKYDWKKDLRYNIYAMGLTTHPEYKKQKTAYMNALREYNMEHPDNIIDDLSQGIPEPYSDAQIMNIKNLADNIYGSYDKSKRPMAEFHSLGVIYGMYTTWFSGIVNNYFMKPQRNGAYSYTEEQEIDESGNPLYWTDDFHTTTQNTGVPVLKRVPMLVQGIFPTIGSIIRVLRTSENGERIEQLKEYLAANPHEKANLRKLLSDALMALLMFLLFKLALDPEYKKYSKKKHMKHEPLVESMLVELLYKGASRGYDQYLGPLNVITYLGDNMNPPIYAQPNKLLIDAMKTVFGDRSAMYMLYDSSGLFRSFKDTFNSRL